MALTKIPCIQLPNLITLDCDAVVMSHNNGRQSPLAMQVAYHIEYNPTGPMIKVAGRLICKKQLRFADQCAGDGDALLFSARDLTNFVVKTLTQADSLQNLLCRSLCLFASTATNESRHHGVLQRREFGQKMMKLKDKPDVTVSEFSQFLRAPFKDVPVIKEHVPSCRSIQTAQQMKKRALSST